MHNPRVKRLVQLARQRSARDDAKVLIAEGPVLVADAAAAGLVIEEVFVEAAAAERPEVAAAVEAAVAAGARAYLLDGSLKGRGAAVTPNGLTAVVGRPSAPPQGPVRADGDLVMVLVGVADPGNVGTLIRVAEVCGASRVVATTGSADPWSPKCVRSSAGSAFRVPIQTGVTAEEVLTELGAQGYRRFGTRAGVGAGFGDLRLNGPIALVLGSEAHGLPGDLDHLLDEVISIPMAGRAESLNVAMAGAIVGFKAFCDQDSDREA